MNISGAHVGLVMDPGDVVVEVVAGGQRDAAIATEVQPRAREVDVLNVLLKGRRSTYKLFPYVLFNSD